MRFRSWFVLFSLAQPWTGVESIWIGLDVIIFFFLPLIIMKISCAVLVFVY